MRIAGLTPRGDDWLQVPGTLPRVRLVTRVLASEDPAHDIQHIDLRTTALTEHSLDLPAASAKQSPGTARLVVERAGRLEIAVDAPTRQLLVVSESYHPGWQASVDGLPQKVLRVNGDFLGCVVGPGKQTVVLEFRPASLRQGRLASATGLGLIVVFLVFGLVRSQRRKPESAKP